MRSTMKHKTRGRKFRRRMATVLVALLFSAVAFVFERYGGQYGLPRWEDLYAMLGVPLDGPDAALLADSDTTLTMLDVGQGDAVLIGQDGAYCLIDTGTAESRDDLVRYLDRAGVEELQYLVLTHPHADHTGGALSILEKFPVGELLLPVWLPQDGGSQWPRGLQEQALAAGTAVKETGAGAAYPLGSGYLHVLAGGNETTGDEDANHASLCLLFEAGDFRYLCTGDAEEAEEQQLVEQYGKDLSATVYKAGHHGSSTSSSEELLELIQPEAALISCGLDNEYGHPHAVTLQRLHKCGAAIFRTDTMGTVTLRWEDGGLQAWTSGERLDAAA